MTAAQKAENERKCSLVLKYCETNYRRIGMYDCQSLHEYYIEHEFGIGGNKATKLFTKAEKRKNKDKICLRKKLVDAVKYLLPHTPATVACMRLEDVYRFDGRKSGCLRDIGRDLKRSPTLSKYFEKYPQE